MASVIGTYEGNNFLVPSANPIVGKLVAGTNVTLSPSTGFGQEVTVNATQVPDGVQTITAGTGVSLTGTIVDPIINNTGVLSVSAGTGISTSGTPSAPVINNAGVLSVSAGTGISTSGTPSAPVINNAGVLSVSAGTNISITGTATAPIVNQVYPSRTFIVDSLFNASFISLTTGGGGQPPVQLISFPVVTAGVYMLTCNVSVSSSMAGPSGPNPRIQVYLSQTAGAGSPPSGPNIIEMLSAPESSTLTGSGTCTTFTVPAGPSFYGVYVQGINFNVSSTATASISSAYLIRIL
jgi:hypothetical protein